MRSSLVMLSAAALFAITLSPVPEADARGARSATTPAEPADAGPRRKSGKAGIRRGRAPARMASAKSPGSCGTFMYWKEGRCNDARNKR